MDTNTSGGKMTPKFFFLSLGVLGSLITVVSSFLTLAFQTLNFKFPDALNATYQYGYSSYNYDGARMAIATLIIFFPIFLILMKYWVRTVKGGLGRVDEVLRRWMIYIVLFLSAVMVAVDLVTLVRYFVAGEITTRFILKVAVTLIVAGYVGVYYMYSLKGKSKMWGFSMNTWVPIKSSILVLALVIWSFTVIGTPQMQRAWRLDDRRVQDLQSIQWQVINYWQQKQKLPEKITDLSNPISGFMLPVDPEFEKGKTYEYSLKDANALTFELCGTFSAKMPQGWVEYGGRDVIPYPTIEGGYGGGKDVAVSYPWPGGTSNDSWDHEIGRTCFERTIDKDLFPPYPKPL